MDRGPRGKCVIINNVNFQDKSFNREGGEHDERELVKLFEELHFEVDLKRISSGIKCEKWQLSMPTSITATLQHL